MHTHAHTLCYPPSRFLVISIFHKGAHAVPIISGLQSLLLPPTVSCGGSSSTEYCTDNTPNHCLCLCVCRRESMINISFVAGCLQLDHKLLQVRRNYFFHCSYYCPKWDTWLKQVNPQNCIIYLVFVALCTRPALLPLYGNILLEGTYQSFS